MPAVIRRALAVEAQVETGTIQDVQHVVILMQENRSFDHYFGTLRGVRGFGDRHPGSARERQAGLVSVGRRDARFRPFIWTPEPRARCACRARRTAFRDAQAAWNQGKFGFWPKFKTPISMGHYQREDIPFQFALAEAFTICDAYHCSVTTGTDPNRIVFLSGSNFDPDARGARRELHRCRLGARQSALLDQGHAAARPATPTRAPRFTWPTIPDVLESAGISWRIYQDPNDNWTGADARRPRLRELPQRRSPARRCTRTA